MPSATKTKNRYIPRSNPYPLHNANPNFDKYSNVADEMSFRPWQSQQVPLRSYQYQTYLPYTLTDGFGRDSTDYRTSWGASSERQSVSVNAFYDWQAHSSTPPWQRGSYGDLAGYQHTFSGHPNSAGTHYGQFYNPQAIGQVPTWHQEQQNQVVEYEPPGQANQRNSEHWQYFGQQPSGQWNPALPPATPQETQISRQPRYVPYPFQHQYMYQQQHQLPAFETHPATVQPPLIQNFTAAENALSPLAQPWTRQIPGGENLLPSFVNSERSGIARALNKVFDVDKPNRKQQTESKGNPSKQADKPANFKNTPWANNPRADVIPRPVPSAMYMKQAAKEPRKIDTAKALLVVLDLNGTLLYRINKRSTFIARPRVKEFLEYLFNHHNVIVWSSAMPKNVDSMCRQLLSKEQADKLIACWARDRLKIPEHAYRQRIQVYKQLSWIWKDKSIQSANPKKNEYWSQDNTILIDDSPVKAASEPFNAVILEEFEAKQKQMESDVLGQVVGYLEKLKVQQDVSAFVRSNPFEFDEKMSFDWSTVVDQA